MDQPNRRFEIEFIILIATLMAIVAMAINMILPAFADITRHFGLDTPTQVGLTVSLLYVGLAFGQITFGAISDNLGRKPAMLAGLGIFVVGTLVSWSAPTFPLLIFGQIIQGFGLGAPRVITVAIIRDRFEGSGMARIMSFIMMIFALVPTVSPYIGQAVIVASDWRMLFVVFVAGTMLAALWFACRLPESHPTSARTGFSFRPVLVNLRDVLSNRAAMVHAATLGIVSGAFIAYLNLSQQIFEFQYGLGNQYPFYFALMSLSLASASFINGRVVVAVGLERLSAFGLFGMIAGSTVLVGIIAISPSDPALPVLLVYLMAMMFCFGILVSNLNALAMKSLGTVAGTGAALVGALTTLISVPLAIMVGNIHHNSVLSLASAFGLFALISLCMVRFIPTERLQVNT
ncbi:hypothetical protein WH95_08190 [Kiloniella litopenaei]|uniref:Major facilitator superfamily (MFS) profile domain-containing protein n=1 Tax=Kiloniella litopenaei TaxID=1549748 RepID=A0A0M2R5T5_9PROT|nr:multidrug effflux MFS transporter [Kiloniella litopenaei]KKJ77056.1 hypothetical protein WH95_08190 [Kiloniella litopenaei]